MSLATLHRRKVGGHYARVMGTLHRHLKAEKAGDAALGMLLRIWSYCADTGRAELSERDLAVIMVRDKNGPRKLKALLDAGLLDRTEGGYTPHDWFDHNPGIDPLRESDVRPTRREREENVRDGEENATENVTGNVTRNVSRPAEQNQAVTPPLSRPRTQDPGDKRENPPNPPGGLAADDRAPLDLPDAGARSLRQPPVGGAYAAEVRDGWASAWHEAKAGTPPRLVGDVWASAVQFARDVAQTHGVPLREAAQRIAAGALASPGDPVWHLTRLDPYAAPRPSQESARGMSLDEQIKAADRELCAAAGRNAPTAELTPLADKLRKLKAQRDERDDQARRYARR